MGKFNFKNNQKRISREFESFSQEKFLEIEQNLLNTENPDINNIKDTIKELENIINDVNKNYFQGNGLVVDVSKEKNLLDKLKNRLTEIIAKHQSNEAIVQSEKAKVFVMKAIVPNNLKTDIVPTPPPPGDPNKKTLEQIKNEYKDRLIRLFVSYFKGKITKTERDSHSLGYKKVLSNKEIRECWNIAKEIFEKQKINESNESQEIKDVNDKKKTNNVIKETTRTSSKKTEISAKKEISGETLDDLAGNAQLKEELKDLLLQIKHRDVFMSYGVNPPKVIIMDGPPGNGKTLSARILSNEAMVPFLNKNGSDFQSKYFGESEKSIKSAFEEAEKLADESEEGLCFLFIDEIESLLQERNGSEHQGGHTHNRRIVTEFLQQIDGFEKQNKVILIGATNHIDQLDNAFVSRAGKIIHVPFPDREGLLEISSLHANKKEKSAKNKIFEENINWNFLKGYYDEGIRMSGRDIANIINNICTNKAAFVIKDKNQNPLIDQEEIEKGFNEFVLQKQKNLLTKKNK